jgi:hypothetical protein
LIRYQIRSAAQNPAAERGKTKPNKNNLQIKSLPTEKLCARIMRAASVRLGRPAGTFRAFVFQRDLKTNLFQNKIGSFRNYEGTAVSNIYFNKETENEQRVRLQRAR